MNIYSPLLIKHFQNPVNNQKIKEPDIEVQDVIPSCGDHIAVQAKIEQGKITQISFIGSGCMISQAIPSIISESMINKKIEFILELDKEFIFSIININFGPNRLKCALFGLNSLKKGIKEYQSSCLKRNAESSKSCTKATDCS